MKKIFTLILACVIFSSCTSMNIAKKNISIEYYSIAQNYEQQKNFNKAIEYYKLAATNPELKESADYKTALCYVYLKDWSNAQKGFEKLLKQDSDNSTIKESIAFVYASNNQLEKAKEIYDELNANNLENESISKNYISVLFALEDYKNAEELFNKFKEKFPDNKSIELLQKKFDALKPNQDSEADAESLEDSEAK